MPVVKILFLVCFPFAMAKSDTNAAFSYIDIYNLEAFVSADASLTTMLKEGIAEMADIDDSQTVIMPDKNNSETPRPYDDMRVFFDNIFLNPNQNDAAFLEKRPKPKGQGDYGLAYPYLDAIKPMQRYCLHSLGPSYDQAYSFNAVSHAEALIDDWVKPEDKPWIGFVAETDVFPKVDPANSTKNPLRCLSLLVTNAVLSSSNIADFGIPYVVVPRKGHITVKLNHAVKRGSVYFTDTVTKFCDPTLDSILDFDLQPGCTA